MLSGIFRKTRKEIIDEGHKKRSLPIDSQSGLKESKYLQELDTAKTVYVTGSRSRSLDRQRNCHGFNCCNPIFPSNEVPVVGDKNVFVSRRHSILDDSRKLHLFENSEAMANTVFSVNERSRSASNMTPNRASLKGTMPEKTDFKTLLTMFLKRSSIYALNQVGNSATNRRKILWIFITIVGLLGSGTQIVQYLIAYFAYPVVVNIDSVSTLSQEFPAVTVCNINSVRRECLPCLKKRLNYNECDTSDDYDAELPVSFTDDMNDTLCVRNFGNVSDALVEQFLWKNLFTLRDNKSQVLYGHQKTDFIRSCSFNGEICSPDDFSSFVNSDYGNCFTFNSANDSSPPLSTPFVGPNGGLELELDLEAEKYAPFTAAVGARLQVHDPYHGADVTQAGINVSPGFETSVTLLKFKMVRLPKPFKDKCEKYATGDSMQICNDRCYDELIFKKCSCFVERDSYGARRCDFSSISDLCCIYSSVDTICDCPLACDDTNYIINIFSAVWPSESYNAANPINNTNGTAQLTIEEVRKTRLKVKVYYDTLATTIYEQKPMYQSSELFSQIGGQMGLWLGLSLVAIFECIENFVIVWQYRAKQPLQDSYKISPKG